ncbi:CD3324 family protein [Virgibacillus kimchii]
MQYKNGKEVLPPSLLKEMQKYIQGELVYIPKAKNKRAGWGEVNGSRQVIKKRNETIYELYKEGKSLEDLESMYNLSVDSIRKIVYQLRGVNNDAEQNS